MALRKVVAERFEIERLAGSGSMGAVYRALDRLTGEAVGLKLLRVEGDGNALRFAREAEVLASLEHPGIVRYVAHGVADSGAAYLAMEWVEGESVAQRLAGAGLTLAESVTLVRRTAEALAVAHLRGIVHRDLKPSNLMLAGGSVEAVKVLDFGIARLAGFAGSASEITRTGAMLGTPGYMAPEQARGARDADARADVFALGCVLFRCLTGRAPFLGDDVLSVLLKIVLEEAPRAGELRPGIPARLDELVARMLAKLPDDRPRDASAVAEELRALGPLDPERPTSTGTGAQALTATERRVMCVVVGQPPPGVLGARDGPWAGVFAEDSAPSDAATWIEDPRPRALRAALAPHGGTLDLLAEGSLLVTVDGTGPATDQAARAARSALALRPLLPDTPLALVAGRGVLADRLPMGEVVDRGVALLKRQASARVRLDEVTAGLLDGRFELGGDAAGLFLRGERDVSEAARTLLGKPTACVGRDRELLTLEAVYDEVVTEPRARVALVVGEAGAGKSRLRYELFQRLAARREPVEVWIGRGDAMRAGSPFGMIAPALRRAAGILDGEPLETRQRKLRARVGRHVAEAELPRVTEFLAELVGAPCPEEQSVKLRAARRDAILMGDQMRRAFEDLLAAECAAQPLVLVLEDLHWGDLPSIRFVDSALRNLEAQPLLVLALARPELRAVFPDLWAGRAPIELDLGRLSRKGSEKLVRQVLGDAASDTLVARLVERATGNAFYLEELIRAAAAGHTDALPDSVIAMVEARLEELDPEARRVLRAGAVFGQAFWKGGVTALLGGEERAHRLVDRLGDLVAREVVTRHGDSRFGDQEEYVFRHALVREAAYATLTDADRALGHRLAGRWLEDAGEVEAITLAEHFERGGEAPRAAGWYARAAEQALEGNDFAAVLARAAKGLACGTEGPARAKLFLLQAEAHNWRAELVEAKTAALAGMKETPRRSHLFGLLARELTPAIGKLGDEEAVAALASELRALASEGDLGASHLLALARVASPLLLYGHRELAQEMIAIVEGAGALALLDPAVRARAEEARALQALCAGDSGGYIARLDSALAAMEQAGDLRAMCILRSNKACVQLEVGFCAEAEAGLRVALADALRMGLQNAVAAARQNLGLALARQGKLDEALTTARLALVEALAHADLRLVAGARMYLALILLLAGRPAAAEEEAARAVGFLSDVPPLRSYAHAVHAAALLALASAEGDEQAATALVQRARAAALEAITLLEAIGGIEEGEALVRLTWGRVLLRSGERSAAREALTTARARLLDRAARMTEPAARASFLGRVPEHLKTFALAAKLAGG